MANRRAIASAAVFMVLLVLGLAFGLPLLLIAAAAAGALSLTFLTGGGWRAWFVLASMSLLAAVVAYGQLDGLLAGMHRFGHASYSLSSVGARTGEPKAAFDAVRGWAMWASQPHVSDLYASPQHVVHLALAVDLVIIASLSAFLLLLFSRARSLFGRIPETQQHEHHSAYLSMARVATWMVLIAAVADLLEDAGYLAAVHRFWSVATPDAAPGWARLLVTLNWWFTAAKFAGFGLAALSLVVVAVGLRVPGPHARMGGELWRTAKTLRGQIVLTLLLGVVFVVHPQAADVIRRWNTRQGVIAYVLALVLVWIAWAFGKRLVTAPSRRVYPGDRILAGIGGGLLAVVLILAVLRAPAWGLAIPAVFWLVVAFADRRLGITPSVEVLPAPGFGRAVLPRLVAVSSMALGGWPCSARRSAATSSWGPARPRGRSWRGAGPCC